MLGPSQNTKVNQTLFWSAWLSSLFLARYYSHIIQLVLVTLLIVNLLGFKISEMFVEDHRMYFYKERVCVSKSP